MLKISPGKVACLSPSCLYPGREAATFSFQRDTIVPRETLPFLVKRRKVVLTQPQGGKEGASGKLGKSGQGLNGSPRAQGSLARPFMGYSGILFVWENRSPWLASWLPGSQAPITSVQPNLKEWVSPPSVSEANEWSVHSSCRLWLRWEML